MSEPANEPVIVTRHPEPLALAQLPTGADVPAWATSATLVSITASAGQTTVVCHAHGVPKKVPSVGPLTAFRTEGDLAAVVAPLGAAGIEAIPCATYGALWLLIARKQADRAAEAWTEAGFAVEEAGQ